MRTTYMAKPGEIDRKWYVIDATDIALGRLSTVVASSFQFTACCQRVLLVANKV